MGDITIFRSVVERNRQIEKEGEGERRSTHPNGLQLVGPHRHQLPTLLQTFFARGEHILEIGGADEDDLLDDAVLEEGETESIADVGCCLVKSVNRVVQDSGERK